MPDLNSPPEWWPLLDALDYADRAIGADAWGLMMDWCRSGRLRFQGRADGVTKDFERYWFDFIAPWGSAEPATSVATEQGGVVASVGRGTVSDRPSRSTLAVPAEYAARFETRPRVTSPDNVLYFTSPSQKQLSAGVFVPRRVSGVLVDMVSLRRLVSDWKSADNTKAPSRSAGRPSARKTSIELFNARRGKAIPLPSKQIEEASAIRDSWPANGPPQPAAKTISEHISSLWNDARKSSDKL